MKSWREETSESDKEDLIYMGYSGEYGPFRVDVKRYEFGRNTGNTGRDRIHELVQKAGYTGSVWDIIDDADYEKIKKMKEELETEVREIYYSALDIIEAAIMRKQQELEKLYVDKARKMKSNPKK